MSLEISRRIRVALESDSPTKNLPEVLIAIDAFVQQQQETDLVALDQLHSEVESVHKDLVDHSVPATVEAFVSILHSFLPVFKPIDVITCWWDLVLRAALRDPRLPVKALQQVKEITLHGLIPDSSKAPEFRKRIIELYLLDVHDEISRRDVLEHAAMSANERRIQQLWKHNLGNILKAFYVEKSQEFLNIIEIFFRSSQRRLKLSVLLAAVVRLEKFQAREFASHPLLDALLLSLMVDGSSTLLEIEIVTLSCLLRHFAVHAPDTLRRVLPHCYAILARVICWRPRSTPPDSWDQEHDVTDVSSPSSLSDHEVDPTRIPPIRPGLDWERLNPIFFSSGSDSPTPHSLFRTLYGLYPCNTLTFLRDPVVYLSNSGLKSPFVADWSDTVDEDQVRTRSRALLRQNILHTSIITSSADSELAKPDRWVGWDVSRIVMMCTMLDVRHTALSLGPSPDVPQVLDLDPDQVTVVGLDLHPPTLSKHTVPQTDNNLIMEPRNTEYPASNRPRVSIQDILATHHVLKSGTEIDLIDPTPTWPHLLIRSVTPPSPSKTTSTLKTSLSGSDDTIPPHVEKAISGLQRENLLLRTELNHELWLKHENVKRIGQLYKDRILVKGAEVERQGLHNKLREYKGQVQRLQDALTKEQAGASAMNAQHADYTGRLQERLRKEKAEKQKWANEKLELKSAYEDAKAMLEAQAGRLADAMENVFKLETKIKENEPKVQRLMDYEDKINQLTKTQQLWDDDIRRYKEQAAYLDDLRSRYRKKLLLIQSYEKANQDLEETILSLRSRVSTLESHTASYRPPEPSVAVYQMMETLRGQISKLTNERDTLMSRNEEQERQIENFRVTVETLQVNPCPAGGRDATVED